MVQKLEFEDESYFFFGKLEYINKSHKTTARNTKKNINRECCPCEVGSNKELGLNNFGIISAEEEDTTPQ